MIKVSKRRTPRVVQGDIIRDVDYIEYVVEDQGVIEVSRITFPLVAVLTQDCDLEQEHRSLGSKPDQAQKHDKHLLSVLVAPLYNVEHVYAGEHLSELQLQMEPINKKKTPGQNLRSNERPRFHYLEFPASVPIVPSAVDFKHYFSVNGAYLKKLKRRNFVCRISELFREDLSLRFANYLSRVGLPDLSTPVENKSPSNVG